MAGCDLEIVFALNRHGLEAVNCKFVRWEFPLRNLICELATVRVNPYSKRWGKVSGQWLAVT